MSNNYNTTIQSNNTDLQAILSKINDLPAMSTTTQAIPSIIVNSSTGLVTATATQTAGYVNAGTKSSTYQLAFQAAKTITPTTTSQIAVSSGYYTGGAVTVVGDSNLVADNIKSGVSIFGVAGTYQGADAVDTSQEDGLVTRTLTSYINNRITKIGTYAFYNCLSLKTVSCANVTTIEYSAFNTCRSLKTVNLPNVTTIGSSAFIGCRFSSVVFPKASVVNEAAFALCQSLQTASFPNLTSINTQAFSGCYRLVSLYLMGSSVCTLAALTAFISTPIYGYSASAGRYGSIFVPASLLTSYQTAAQWSYFSSRFVGV